MNQVVLSKTLDYLALKIPDFKSDTRGRHKFFTCPTCFAEGKATFIARTGIMYCHGCAKRLGTLYDVVRELEVTKNFKANSDVDEYMNELFNLGLVTETSVDKALDYYVSQGMDMVPIVRNGKIPFEKDWPNKVHKDKHEWTAWLGKELNMGAKTGKSSSITVVDIDGTTIPAGLLEHLKDYQGLAVKTKKGFHYFFQYESDLPKSSFELDYTHVDIENDGGQVVVFPSVVDGHSRELLCMKPIPKMSAEFKQYLVKLLGVADKPAVVEPGADFSDIDSADATIQSVQEGGRNNFLVRLGGVFRKELNIEQTRFVMEIINQKFINPSIPQHELRTIVGSLEKYIKFDEKDIAKKVLDYMRVVGEAEGRDVKEVVGESKELVDKSLAYLMREGYLVKNRRFYQIIRRADWKDHFGSQDEAINFKMPYFHDIANFCTGDLVLLCSKNKRGKTTIAMNIVKSLVEQGIKPYYMSLEAGSRFKKTWIKLNGLESDFYNDFQSDPTKVELEKNAVTIIDWLMIEDKSQTDKIFKYFVEQLYKNKGFLIIFMQLKDNNEYFAPNMVNQFPALSARYIYDEETNGASGQWLVDVVRDPKDQVKTTRVPCRYDWETRRLVRVEGTEQGVPIEVL